MTNLTIAKITIETISLIYSPSRFLWHFQSAENVAIKTVMALKTVAIKTVMDCSATVTLSRPIIVYKEIKPIRIHCRDFD